MDAVGSDNQVILASRTISEGHIDLVTLLVQSFCHGAKAYPHTRSAVEQDAM
jgi:hypothetical protein